MKLASGIENFQTLVYPQMKNEFRSLERGPSPETLFITCSDFRIDPNLVTKTAPGELFVVRNAGNIVLKPGTGELSVEATIQFAVDVLNVSQIVVCGHSHCGAVAELLNLDTLESMPAIKDWVRKSEKVLDRLGDFDNKIDKVIQANVLLQLEQLMEYPHVAKALEEGWLKLYGCIYHFENGKVEFLTQNPLTV